MVGIWWRHATWISKIQKIDFLKNEKSFWSEIKTFFQVSLALYVRLNTNVADKVSKNSSNSNLVPY